MEFDLIKDKKRGFSDYKWCQAHYCYSFGPYYNPLHNKFGLLEGVNDFTLFKLE
jgi:hypothetical protein